MRGTLIGGSAVATKPASPVPSVQQYFLPLAALGFLLTGVSLFDLGYSWFPMRFGNEEWELGTISRTFDGLPLGTVGLGFLTVVATAKRSRIGLGVLAVVFTIGVIVLLGMVALYALNVPVALGAAPPQAVPVLKRAVARTAVFMTLYLPFYGWLSWFTWRQFSNSRKGAGE